MVADIRAKAREILAAVPETGQITSNGATVATFMKLTGTFHDTMKKNGLSWAFRSRDTFAPNWHGTCLGEVRGGHKAEIWRHMPPYRLGQTIENFTATDVPKTHMNGTSNRWGPLVADRINSVGVS